MELAEIYKKLRELAEELDKTHNIQITYVRFDWTKLINNESLLIDIDMDTSKRG